jgi:hypothetical protein
MTHKANLEYWQVWYPKAAATGLHVARGLLDATSSLLLHAAPDVITVEVMDENGVRLAQGKDLKRTEASPMCRLERHEGQITRRDCWPSEADIGSVVLLPGGEVGVLKKWWHADDKKEWRLEIELYNSIR